VQRGRFLARAGADIRLASGTNGSIAAIEGDEGDEGGEGDEEGNTVSIGIASSTGLVCRSAAGVTSATRVI